MEKVEMKLWKWIALIVLGPVLLVFVVGLFESVYGLEIPMWIASIVYVVGALIVVGCYLLYEKWYSRWSDSPITSKIKNKSFLKDITKGMLLGFGYFCAVVLIMMLLGCYSIKSCQFDAMPLLMEFLLLLLVAVGEECVFRGVIFRLIDDRWGWKVALIVSSLIFGLIHITNDAGNLWGGIAIVIEAGLLLGAAYKMSGSLWFPIGIHWTWNFTQGNVFGFIVSGNPEMPASIITPELSGPELITGGAFGAEASVIAVVLGFLISCLMIYKIRQQEKQTVTEYSFGYSELARLNSLKKEKMCEELQ